MREGKGEIFFPRGLADEETKAREGKSFHSYTASGWSGQITAPRHLPPEPSFAEHVLCVLSFCGLEYKLWEADLSAV